MSKGTYTTIPLDEEKNELVGERSRGCDQYSTWKDMKGVCILVVFAVLWFGLGIFVGCSDVLQFGNGKSMFSSSGVVKSEGLLPPQAFVPHIPMKEVVFEFPSKYEDTGVEGDELWKEMMPTGAGFLRVPNPRIYDMPQSKAILDDPEDSEVYSLSITHQLHCLAVLRDVIKKYEKKDKSRFAGDGHEYHCLDYIRQSVLCAGDTTLDFAEAVVGADGMEHRNGFTGAGSTHVCRDWDAIKAFATENRSGDNVGII